LNEQRIRKIEHGCFPSTRFLKGLVFRVDSESENVVLTPSVRWGTPQTLSTMSASPFKEKRG